MSSESRRISVRLGQPVRLVTDRSGRIGHVVAVLLATPDQALVRWRDAPSTFEELDDLRDEEPPSGLHETPVQGALLTDPESGERAIVRDVPPGP